MNIPKSRFVAWLGGVLACLVLLGAGIAYITVGLNGRSEVNRTVSREQIVGTPDMTPTAIRAELSKAGLKNVSDIPTCSVANQHITNGDQARCFAGYMRIHALLASGGLTYAQMGQFLTKDGTPTSDVTKAAIDPQTQKPVQNAARQTWVTETALTTGLNMSYFAEQVSLFGIVMGACMLVIGIGLGVLTVVAFGLMPWRTAEVPPRAVPVTH
jgi:hypothetical protein